MALAGERNIGSSGWRRDPIQYARGKEADKEVPLAGKLPSLRHGFSLSATI